MQGVYSTVYIRRSVELSLAPAIRWGYVLSIRADDGFVAYVNGKECARVRAGAPGSLLAHDSLASATALEPLEEVRVRIPPDLLVEGRNVFAIQGLQVKVDSSDFSLIPAVGGESSIPDPASERRRHSAFLESEGGGSSADSRRAYLEGRILQRAGRLSGAALAFLEAALLEPLAPEPWRRLAECWAR